MPLKCLLVDDEPPALNVLVSYLESMDNLELVGKCYNAFEAMQLLQQVQVDILFLDIRMPRLLGTEFVRTLRHPPKVIFTTAHKDYALDAFDLDVVDYLLKPFSLERFIRAVNKATADGPMIAPVAGAASAAVATPVLPADAFVYFRVDRKMIKVELDEIVYIESLKDYIRIVRAVQKPLLVKKSISVAEEMLPGNLFIRVHRSFIVALKKVTAYTQNDVEINGLEIPIGKLYKHQIHRLATVRANG